MRPSVVVYPCTTTDSTLQFKLASILPPAVFKNLIFPIPVANYNNRISVAVSQLFGCASPPGSGSLAIAGSQVWSSTLARGNILHWPHGLGDGEGYRSQTCRDCLLGIIGGIAYPNNCVVRPTFLGARNWGTAIKVAIQVDTKITVKVASRQSGRDKIMQVPLRSGLGFQQRFIFLFILGTDIDTRFIHIRKSRSQ